MSTSLISAERRAKAAEADINVKRSSNGELTATITAIELYMQALRLAESPVDRRRIDGKCKQLLVKAEALKSKLDGPSSAGQRSATRDMKQPVSTRVLTTRENIIVLEGSKLNGAIFKPWTGIPAADEFNLRQGDSLFTDPTPLPISSENFAGWQRPWEALRRIEIVADGRLLPNEASMKRLGTFDLIQDMTSDCSVVASLCAGTSRVERGHPKISGSIIYPYDHNEDTVMVSPNGKYILRMYFNGCWRRVEIDDRLPTSKDTRLLHVIDRTHPGLLWPALLEKAYLKVRGGYEFPGSNSGTDLAVMTGWIPQQVFLHDEDVEPSQLWEEVVTAFHQGDVLLTLGTGKLSQREQRHLGLAAEHDYTVLDAKSEGSVKELLVKNPWSNGDVWTGATRRKPNTSHGKNDSATAPDISDGMTPGTFWMDFNSVFQYFENMYINWNPNRFSHRQDMHFSWQVTDQIMLPSLFLENPQFTVQSAKTNEIWVLLNRHFRTGDYTQENHGKNGYIGLYLYDKSGNKIFASQGAVIRGPFVDSPNTLLRFQARPSTVYTVVVVSQDLPIGKHNFTVSAFSKSPISLAETPSQYSQVLATTGGWTRASAGGNSDCATYLANPQFLITNAVSQKVAFVLQLRDHSASATNANIHLKILISFSTGERIIQLRSRDIVANSGDYHRGNAVIETTLPNGKFVAICSTFDQGQLAKFGLEVHTEHPQSLKIVPLPAEGSGRRSFMSNAGLLSNATSRILAPLTLSRLTKSIILLRPDSAVTSSSLLKLSLEQGQGPYKTVLHSTAHDENDFRQINDNLRINDTDLSPALHGNGTGGLWLVVERIDHSHQDDVIRVEFLADEPVEIGAWGTGEG